MSWGSKWNTSAARDVKLRIRSCASKNTVPMSVAVGSWTVGGPNSKEALRDVVVETLADFGLTGVVEGPAA